MMSILNHIIVRLLEVVRAHRVRHRWRAVATIVAISVFCSALGSSRLLAGEADYRLGTGDVLRVTVFGHRDLSGEFEVSSTGDITLPLIGEVLVVDRTLREAESAIVTELQPD